MANYHQPLFPNQTYHLFSRAVGNEKLFLSEENYRFFIQKLKQHTSSVSRLYCYTLIPNHFHLLAKINDEDDIKKEFEEVKNMRYEPKLHNLCDFIMERFSNFLNSYAKAFNKMYHRKGSLFMDYMKRSIVNKDSDFTSYIWYIHKNAVHHHLAGKIGEWKFDSYNTIIGDAPTSLLRGEVIDWFGGKQNYIAHHQQGIQRKVKFLDF